MVDLRPRAEVVQEHSVHFWREVVLRDWIILWNGEKTVKERYSTFICSLQTDHSLFGCFWFPSCYLEEPRFCRIINSPELQSSLKSTSLKNTYKLIYQLPWGTVIPSLSTCEGGGRDISPSNPLTHSRNRCVSPDKASELTPSGAEPVFLSEQNRGWGCHSSFQSCHTSREQTGSLCHY